MGASYSFEVRGEEYPNTIRENKHRKETFLGNESAFSGMGTNFLGIEMTFLESDIKK